MTTTVILTRPKGPFVTDDGLPQRLKREGFAVVQFSALRIELRELQSDEVKSIVASLDQPDAWIAFLSPTAVHVVNALCEKIGYNVSASKARIGAQGPGTSDAARKVFGREVDLESTISTAEVFAQQLSIRLQGKGRVLVPQSFESRDVLGPLLRQSGNTVTTIATYGPVVEAPGQEEIEGVRGCSSSNSFIVFMSPSAVRATVEHFPDSEQLKTLRAISIGPSTSKAMRECGLTVFSEAEEHTESGILTCLVKVSV